MKDSDRIDALERRMDKLDAILPRHAYEDRREKVARWLWDAGLKELGSHQPRLKVADAVIAQLTSAVLRGIGGRPFCKCDLRYDRSDQYAKAAENILNQIIADLP